MFECITHDRSAKTLGKYGSCLTVAVVDLEWEHTLVMFAVSVGENHSHVSTEVFIKLGKSFKDYLDLDSFFQQMKDNAFQESGEYSEGYLDDVLEYQEKELENLILAWAEKHSIKPNWYSIEILPTYNIYE